VTVESRGPVLMANNGDTRGTDVKFHTFLNARLGHHVAIRCIPKDNAFWETSILIDNFWYLIESHGTKLNRYASFGRRAS